MKIPSDHRHLAGGLAGADHPQEPRLLAFFAPDRREAAGADQIKVIGLFPHLEQGLAAGQGEAGDFVGERLALEHGAERGVGDVMREAVHDGEPQGVIARRMPAIGCGR